MGWKKKCLQMKTDTGWKRVICERMHDYVLKRNPMMANTTRNVVRYIQATTSEMRFGYEDRCFPKKYIPFTSTTEYFETIEEEGGL